MRPRKGSRSMFRMAETPGMEEGPCTVIFLCGGGVWTCPADYPGGRAPAFTAEPDEGVATAAFSGPGSRLVIVHHGGDGAAHRRGGRPPAPRRSDARPEGRPGGGKDF